MRAAATNGTRLGAVALLVSALGCTDRIVAPELTPQPVIQALLVAGAPQQFVRADWLQSANAGYTGAPQPIGPSDIALTIRTPDGREVAFQPTDSAGLFAVTLAVQPGQSYVLAGTVAAQHVQATTRVPGQLVIRAPAGDPIALQAEANGDVPDLPYAWAAPGAAAYWFTLSSSNPARPGAYGYGVRDTVGVLRVFGDTTRTQFRVLAFDSVAAGFLLPATRPAAPRGNLGAVLGFFGSATQVQRRISWQ